MPEVVRYRDTHILHKGDTHTVIVNQTLSVQGWVGGQGVGWVASTKDEPTVGPNSGTPGGFLLWGSDEASDDHTSMTRNQLFYRFAVYCYGSWLFSTSTYEKYTYASRQAGPLVQISYSSNDRLYFSLRGYWTKEDEWTLSGDPRAPNLNVVGYVVQVPSVITDQYITIQTTL